MELSIIIVNWNAGELLSSCIMSVKEAVCNLISEIIVVDNNSTDGSVEYARSRHPEVIFLQNAANLGFGSGVNAGASHARGRNLAILNPDVIVQPDTLRSMLDHLNASPNLGAIGCRLVGPDGKNQSTCARFPTPLRIIFLFTRLDRILSFSAFQTYYNHFDWKSFSMKPWGHDESRNVDTVLGALFMMPSDIFKSIGGFDARYFMYYEEVDLFKKLQKARYYVYFMNYVYAIHYGGESTKTNYDLMRLEQQRSLIIYVRKWHGILWARIIHVMFVVLAFIRLLWAKTYKFLYASSRPEGERLLNTASVLFNGLIKIRIRGNG